MTRLLTALQFEDRVPTRQFKEFQFIVLGGEEGDSKE